MNTLPILQENITYNRGCSITDKVITEVFEKYDISVADTKHGSPQEIQALKVNGYIVIKPRQYIPERTIEKVAPKNSKGTNTDHTEPFLLLPTEQGIDLLIVKDTQTFRNIRGRDDLPKTKCLDSTVYFSQ